MDKGNGLDLLMDSLKVGERMNRELKCLECYFNGFEFGQKFSERVLIGRVELKVSSIRS